MQLSQKLILITGGNSGIGLQLVKQLHAKGNHIIIVSRSQSNWNTLIKLQPEVATFQCDLSKKDQVLKLVSTLSNNNIKPDILINCAAVQNTPMLTDDNFSFDKIESEITCNFTAPIWLTSLLLPTLLTQRDPAIVNLSSGLAFYPKKSSAVYCATKAAIHNFSQSLRYQLTDTPVQVTEVILPLVDTPMTAGRGSGKISSEYAAEKIIAGIKNKRNEIYVGKARLLPIMIQIWPGLVKQILRKY